MFVHQRIWAWSAAIFALAIHTSADNDAATAIFEQQSKQHHRMARPSSLEGANAKQLPIEFPAQLTLTQGRETDIKFTYRGNLSNSHLELAFQYNSAILRVHPAHIEFTPTNLSRAIEVLPLSPSSRTFLDVANCSMNRTEECPFDKEDVFIRLTVVKSSLISMLVIITGWIYFFAWSISFYPQIILNWQRKSVIGLNFDFLVLNVIGFACYTVYNVLMYFDPYVQDIYVERHGSRSLIPVLMNDVVFASHALLACIITGIQCFFYERGNQRISYICQGWASLLLCFSFVSLALAVFHALNWLDFINYLAYAKMAVTLSKYFPQAILNFKRKSTVGWSIGNVLLDFCGGFMDILQMVLQATNTDDWSAFTGNPVKFGLGLVSMLFDVVFFVQHYVLYREHVLGSYNQVDTADIAPVLATATTPLVQDATEPVDASATISP